MAEYNLDDILVRYGRNPNRIQQVTLNRYLPLQTGLQQTAGPANAEILDMLVNNSPVKEGIVKPLPVNSGVVQSKQLNLPIEEVTPKINNYGQIQPNTTVANLSNGIKPKKPISNASYKLGRYDKLYNKLVARSPIFKYAPVATDLYDVSAGNYKMRHGHPFIGAAQTGLGIVGLGLDAAAALAMATGLGAPEGAGALIAKEAGKQAIKAGGKRALGWAAKKYGSLAGKRQLASMSLDAPVYIPEVYNFIKELTSAEPQETEEDKAEENKIENSQPTQLTQPTQPQQNVYYPSQQTVRAYDNVGQMMQNMYNSPDYRPPRYEDDDVEIWEE